MKLLFYLIPLFTLFLVSFSQEVPFQRGVNLSGWLTKSSAHQVQFSRFTKTDFENIKSLGCDHIRLPIQLHDMAGQAPDYVIDPLLFQFLDQIIDWAEELDLKLILDNHTFDPAIDTSPDVVYPLIATWKQVAARYRDRPQRLFYEILNEPHGIADSVWNDIQLQVIDAIRTEDTIHTIVVGPAEWNSYHNLHYMPFYSDSNLIYTFHFYDPFLFTHQGASWADPPMEIAGVPFPYEVSRMPALPLQLSGTWIENLYNNYPAEGTAAWVKNQLNIAVAFKLQRQQPLWCGEFGAYIPNSTTSDRARWIQTVRSFLEQNGIAWSMWEYQDGFGVFEPGTSGLFDYDLNIPIVEALGLTPAPQQEFELVPDSTGFNLYHDYIAPGMYEESWIPNGILDYYSANDPVSGQFCIEWGGVELYGFINLRFVPLRDLSLLVELEDSLDFWIRGYQSGAKIDLRFLDSKTADPGDHPWRMVYTVEQPLVHWDGSWNHLRICLKDFREQGSWDNNQWYNPVGEFDWKAIDQFQIAAEHHSLQGMEFFIDEIRIVGPSIGNQGENQNLSKAFRLLENYPNPFNSGTTIPFDLKEICPARLSIFNVSGQQVYEKSLTNLQKGRNEFIWNGKRTSGQPLASGFYFYRLEAAGEQQTHRMLLLR
jgi:endoglucanase